MKAALYRETGEASAVLRVEEIARPEPGPGQVRVRIACSGVNPTDWKSRSGAGISGLRPEDFQIPHHDGSGVIDAVGEEVSELAVGQRVWTYLAAFGNRYGTAADYAVVPVDRTVPLPDNASDELGACLGVPALTAAHCLGGDPAALSGATVLVAGGAGAVGHYAIELAKHAGARVVATVSSDDKAELARLAGADLVVNYHDPDAIEQVRSFSPHFDRIVEVALGANLELDLAVAHAGTIIAVYASEATDPVIPLRQLMAANISIHYVLLYGLSAEELAAAVTWTTEATAAGALSALPAHRYPLSEIAAAHDAVEQGAVGKVLVVPGMPPGAYQPGLPATRPRDRTVAPERGDRGLPIDPPATTADSHIDRQDSAEAPAEPAAPERRPEATVNPPAGQPPADEHRPVAPSEPAPTNPATAVRQPGATAKPAAVDPAPRQDAVRPSARLESPVRSDSAGKYPSTVGRAEHDRGGGRIKLRLDREEEARLRVAAAANGETLTGFLISAAAERAEEVLARVGRVALDGSAYQSFLSTLNAPVGEMPHLKVARPDPTSVQNEGLGPVELLSDISQLDKFDSGAAELDSWLQRSPRLADAAGTPATYVVRRGPHTVGYYALAMSAVVRSQPPTRVRRRLPETVPVVLLARLTVDRNEQGQYLAGHLLVDALRRSVRGGREFSAQAVVVDGVDERGADFYRHFDFHELDGRRLWRPLIDIASALDD